MRYAPVRVVRGRVDSTSVPTQLGPRLWGLWLVAALVVGMLPAMNALAALITGLALMLFAPAIALWVFPVTRGYAENVAKWQLRVATQPVRFLLRRLRLSLATRRPATAVGIAERGRRVLVVMPPNALVAPADAVTVIVYRRLHDWVAIGLRIDATKRVFVSGSFVAGLAMFAFLLTTIAGVWGGTTSTP